MALRIGNLFLKEGDTVVFAAHGKTETGKVVKQGGREVTIQGAFGSAKVTLRSKKGDESDVTIEIDQRDEDGRELLVDG